MQEATPQFKVGTEVVALDLVVRDKKGKLVTDLQEGEIEVLEGGVPQKLTSFRAVPPAPSAGVAPGAAAPPVGTEGAARRVVLAFDRLSSDGRRLAQTVALGGTLEQVEASRARMLPLARRLALPPGS